MSNHSSYQAAADAFGIPLGMVRRMANDGMVSVLRVPGSKPRIDLDELRRALARYTSPAKGPTPSPAPPVDLSFKTAG